jgi:hypothetical protein
MRSSRYTLARKRALGSLFASSTIDEVLDGWDFIDQIFQLLFREELCDLY